MTTQKTALIALAGPPNAGKSTLLNALVGEKVSIVSAKAQTTRTRIRGIVSEGETQLVFVDTPGLFDPKKNLERAIVRAAEEGMADTDMLCVVLDASSSYCRKDTSYILKVLSSGAQNVHLILNKVDQVKKEDLLALSAELNEQYPFAATYMISAKKGSGVGDLLKDMQTQAPENPWLFAEDEITDMPNRLMAAEITREHLFHRLHQELPYQLTVETEAWENFDNGDVKISQVVYVTRSGHKGIILGRQGQTLKAVSTAARREMETLFDRRVHLSVFIKIREKWLEDPERFSQWGLSI